MAKFLKIRTREGQHVKFPTLWNDWIHVIDKVRINLDNVDIVRDFQAEAAISTEDWDYFERNDIQAKDTDNVLDFFRPGESEPYLRVFFSMTTKESREEYESLQRILDE